MSAGWQGAGSGVSAAYRDNFEHLADELRHLDLLIRLRTLSVQLPSQFLQESPVAHSAFISADEVSLLLAQEPAAAAGDPAADAVQAEIKRMRAEIDARVAAAGQTGVFLALPQLGRLFGLSPFELQAIVICLAPELQRKYDRLYAYLQDDITRKRPSIDLVLELLCQPEAERWSGRAYFADHAPLLRAGLIQRVEDPYLASGSSGLAQFLRLDSRILQYVLGNNQIDAHLLGLARVLRQPAEACELAVDPTITARLLGLVRRHFATDDEQRKLVIYFYGPYGAGKSDLALRICQELDCPLLSVDLDLVLSQGPETEPLLRLAFREGLLLQAGLYIEHADALLQPAARPALKALTMAIAESGWLVFLAGWEPWTLCGTFASCLFQAVELPVPPVPLRTVAWSQGLAGRAPEAGAWAAELAAQFRLTPGQIHDALELAANQQVMAGAPGELTLASLYRASRAQSSHELAELAVKIEPRYCWEDIILPADKIAHLREIGQQVRYRYQVFDAWGFGQKLAHGRGLSMLFAGPPGTGKTMAAEVLAHDLGLEMYKVDLSGVVSKYIGETEKNLSRIFAGAETSNAILFFDEADALFGKRTEVSDAHDRYANIETSYLLQKMEEYEGAVILATNLRTNMDEAFTRRIRFVVEFPFPDEADRQRIWQTHFPPQAPLGSDVNFAYLARELQVTGGNIKNIILNAAFLAAQEDCPICMAHILRGARREFEKIGKLWREPAPGSWNK